MPDRSSRPAPAGGPDSGFLRVGGEGLTIAGGDRSGPAGYARALVDPSGRIVVGYVRGAGWNYFVGGTWTVIASTDGGRSWQDCTDPDVPFTWPGSSARECHDRATGATADGTRWAAGILGWIERDESDRRAALEAGHFVTPDPLPGRPGRIGVGTDTIFLQTAGPGTDEWRRREWDLTTGGWTLGQHREVVMDDGTVVLPARQRSHDGRFGRFLAVRISPGSGALRVSEVPRDLAGRTGSEAAIARLTGDRLLMLMRADASRGGSGRLLAAWSEDAGRTWTVPVETDIVGRPPHLLRLRDGRLLVTYGHQQTPFGVCAAVSSDDGESWQHPRFLVAEDTARAAEDEPIGYHPMTVELVDGTQFTCYYRRRGPTTDAVAVRWRLPD